MTISIDFSSPIIRIKGLETKYDFVGASNSFIRVVGDYLPARIIQQFHFWLGLNKGGIVIDGYKWIYKSQLNLRTEAVVGFTEYQVRKANNFLLGEGILIRQQLHREHYGAKHACAAYNRQYYYRLDYEALRKFLVRQIKKLRLQISFVKPPKTELVAHPLLDGTLETEVDQPTATNTETVGFVKAANQIREPHQSVSRMSPNTTDTTFKTDRSNSPSVSPPNSKASAREKHLQRELAQPSSSQTQKQEQADSLDPRSKPINPKPIPFTRVVARPPCVEQKVNRGKVVRKPVLDEVEADAEAALAPDSSARAAVREDVGADSCTSLPVETNVAPQKPPSKRRKTPKGTKPSFDPRLAPWTSLEQFRSFYRALIASPYVRRMAKNLEALVNRIVNELRQGVPHPFWDDFIAGRPIGSSTRQEWQMPDGSPHPDFIEYLAEKLIRGNNTQTREIAISEALRIAKDPETARFFWKECKVSLVNAKARTERARALGVSNPVTPTWTHERVEPTVEEAAAASMEIKGINQQTTRAIEAASNPQAQLAGRTTSIPPGTEKAEVESVEPTAADPWSDEEPQQNPQKRMSIRETIAQQRGGIDRIPKIIQPKKASRRHRARPPKLDLKDLNLDEINRALTDPVLNADLTPQLMQSHYELITDEFGRIRSVKRRLADE